MKFVAGVVLTCLTAAVSATTLIGGGSTLPTIGYTGQVGLPVAQITPVAGSLFGVYVANHTGTSVAYCPTGGGVGMKIFAGNDPLNFQVNAACGGIPPLGFGGTGLTQAHFAASDAPISLSQYAAYVNGHGYGTQPTQLPAIAGAIGIVFKKLGLNALTLNEAQICGIFSGQITDWSAISTASGPINIVYQRDGSGTSFSFLNHLSAVCPATVTAATQFKTLQSFATGAASYLPSYVSALPLGGANGDAGVVAAVARTDLDGSIGYAEVVNSILGGVRAASVKNLAGTTVNPLTGFGPIAMPVTPIFDKALSDTVDWYGRPILVDLPATSNGCIALVDPASYANPATGYPIVAISYLLGNQQGNGADTASIRGLLGTPYDTSIRSSVAKIGRVGTGYTWLSNALLTQSRVDSCIN